MEWPPKNVSQNRCFLDKKYKKYYSNTGKGVRLVIMASNFTKNKHLIMSLRILTYFDHDLSLTTFFKKIIFNIYFQLTLLWGVGLILMKNSIDSTFSNKFYILCTKERNFRQVSKFMDLQRSLPKTDHYFVNNYRSVQFIFFFPFI